MFLFTDFCLLAHGEIFLLFKDVILLAVLIVLSVVNSVIALPIAIFAGWRLFRTERKRWRFALGLTFFLTIFFGLWVLEAVVFFMNVDIPNRTPKP